MSKLKVAILFGGKSGEHEVSIVSALSVYSALDKEKYDVTMIGIDKMGRWLLPDQSVLLANSQNPRLINLNEFKKTVSLLPFQSQTALISLAEDHTHTTKEPGHHIDVVIPILHGTYGEDGTVQGLLELANIPYVGAGVLGSAIAMDKDVSKRLLRDAKISVVPFLVMQQYEYKTNLNKYLQEIESKFGFPYFVKPANMGSSVGIHKIKNQSDAQKKIEDAFLYDTKILIEKAIEARELECAVLGNHNPQASIVGEIIPHAEFYSYQAKYIDADGAELSFPAKNLSNDIVANIQTMAVAAFKILECSGMARVDFFLDKRDGKLYLNELNTIPGFTSISMYPKMWSSSGIPYSQLLDRLIQLALERHAEKNKLKTTFDGE